MPQLIWLPSALNDTYRLYQFLAEKDKSIASQAINTIRQSIHVLARQPELGRPVAEMDLVFREWLVKFGGSGYSVLYRLDGDVVAILAIKHQKEVGYNKDNIS